MAAGLTPARINRAQGWFERWGPAALVFGRHVPGLRVPLTVGAGMHRDFVLVHPEGVDRNFMRRRFVRHAISGAH